MIRVRTLAVAVALTLAAVSSAGGIAYASYGASQFHAKCDNRGATFFVAKTAGGKVFGGYTAVAWTGGSGDCGSHTDPNAFLFSVTNNLQA